MSSRFLLNLLSPKLSFALSLILLMAGQTFYLLGLTFSFKAPTFSLKVSLKLSLELSVMFQDNLVFVGTIWDPQESSKRARMHKVTYRHTQTHGHTEMQDPLFLGSCRIKKLNTSSDKLILY